MHHQENFWPFAKSKVISVKCQAGKSGYRKKKREREGEKYVTYCIERRRLCGKNSISQVESENFSWFIHNRRD